jgi:hypothetical protein
MNKSFDTHLTSHPGQVGRTLDVDIVELEVPRLVLPSSGVDHDVRVLHCFPIKKSPKVTSTFEQTRGGSAST